jgi:pimeloyl-ACP methyl ester carboxylesterase
MIKPIDKYQYLILTVFLTLLLGSCSKEIKPDLAQLYNTSHISYDRSPPVILIHGIMGSKLRDKNNLKEFWFGSLKNLIFSNYIDVGLQINPETLEPIDTNLEPFDIADKAAGTDYYYAVIQTLQKYGGYTLTPVEQEVRDFSRRLYVFTYDWRQDNVKSAKKLNEFINQIKRNHNDPQLKVDLVAHSMGGLISRYYLRYGDQDVLNGNDFPVNLNGAQNVNKVILLGTPNFGSVGSVESFITGLQIGLRKIPTEILVTMPSIYQLFPHSINTWLININGEPLERDVFDSDIWQSFQWSIYDPKVQKRIAKQFADSTEADAYIETLKRYFHKHLERARRFLWSLSVPIENPPYKIIVMGGDCSLTSARLLVEEVNGISITRLKPSQIKRPKAGINYQALMMEPGDGTVTKASLLARNVLDPTAPQHKYSFFPLDYPYFLCEEHSTLTSNINFEDNLLHILLSQ